ncbi:MAG TPA: D-glucuronyl C5-epimerase family protein [Baekduia sp.]
MRRTPVLVVLLLLSTLALLPGTARAKGPSVGAELNRLQDDGELDAATADSYRTVYDDARKTLKKLTGFRRVQLRAVVANVDAAARAHLFAPSRLKAEFLTLQRNRAWWSAAPLPYAGQRHTFAGSQVVWQFYPGQGWQIQWLATFGKANALWMVKTRDADLRRLLDEALGLATQRAGGIAFEYLFKFDRGQPPWVSGLAQGTALSALSRAAVRLKDTRYFDAARSALGIFKTPPPAGIARPTSHGTHYLQYSYAPELRIVNGFTQALNGLHDFAALANDAEGRALFASGEQALRAELPGFDTGAWSLYSKPGAESNLNYHKVLRDFLQGLCDRMTADPAGPSPKLYCDTAQRFTADLTTKPKLEITAPSTPLRARRAAHVAFTLSKISTVTITARRAGRLVLDRSARLAYGHHLISVKPSQAGPLVVRVAATDLAGNANATQVTLHVRPSAKKRGGV